MTEELSIKLLQGYTTSKVQHSYFFIVRLCSYSTASAITVLILGVSKKYSLAN